MNEEINVGDFNIGFFRVLLIVSLIFALLNTVLFSGGTSGYIGMSIYTVIVSIILFIAIRRLDLIKDRSGFLWLIPINLIAISNGIFYTNTHFLNIIAIHLLFSLLIIKVTNINFRNFYNIDLYLAVFRNFVPNFSLSSKAIDTGIFYNRDKKSFTFFKKVLLGVIIAIPFLFIIIILLASADSNFQFIFDSLLDLNIFNDVLYRIIYFTFMFCFFTLYGIKAFSLRNEEAKEYKQINFDSTIASTFLLLLNILYIIFLFLQLKYIVKDGIFVLPSGFDYYEYAYAGFFPTFIVTVINLCVVLFMTEFTKIDFRSKFFRLNFYIIFASNFLLILNAINRMYIYIEEYGFTTDRGIATFVLIFEFIVMVLLILKFMRNIQFYKYAFISFVLIYCLQNYICNDYVNTYLNFQKFDISYEDIVKSSLANADDNYYWTILKNGHSLTFNKNIDSCGYIANNYSVDLVKEGSSNTMYNGKEKIVEYENYFDAYDFKDRPFYGKTYFQLKSEGLLKN